MKKYFIYLFFIFLSSLNFLSCQKQKEEIKTSSETVQKIEENNILKITKKYVDFYDQDENSFAEIHFNDENFLPKEILNEIPQINIGNEENRKNLENILIISLNDDTNFEASSLNIDSGVKIPLSSFYLNKGEAFLIKINLDDYFADIEILAENKNIFTNTIVYPLYLSENEKEIHKVNIWKGNKNREYTEFLNRELIQKNGSEYIKANGKVDLNGDGKDEEISFIGDEHDFFEPFKMQKEKGKLIINGKEFILRKLLEESEISFDKDIEWDDKIFDIEIIDIDRNKKIVLKKRDFYEAYRDLVLIYSFEDEKLNYIGNIQTSSESVLQNYIDSSKNEIKIYEPSSGNLFFPYQSPVIYSLKDNKLENFRDKEKISIFYNNSRIVVETKDKVNLYEDPELKNLSSATEIGDILILLETNPDYSWVKVKKFKDNKIFYIPATEFENSNTFFRLPEFH